MILKFGTVADLMPFLCPQCVLKDKIEARDEMRRELYEKLGTSVEEINSLPLQDRGKRVQVDFKLIFL